MTNGIYLLVLWLHSYHYWIWLACSGFGNTGDLIKDMKRWLMRCCNFQKQASSAFEFFRRWNLERIVWALENIESSALLEIPPSWAITKAEIYALHFVRKLMAITDGQEPWLMKVVPVCKLVQFIPVKTTMLEISSSYHAKSNSAPINSTITTTEDLMYLIRKRQISYIALKEAV